MKISVWDTYVERKDGGTMHFDILVPKEIINEQIVFDYGKDYLKTKPFMTKELTAKECKLCHVEQASEETLLAIKKTGYAIIEIENCT